MAGNFTNRTARWRATEAWSPAPLTTGNAIQSSGHERAAVGTVGLLRMSLPDPYVCLPDLYVCLPDPYVRLPDLYVCLPDPVWLTEQYKVSESLGGAAAAWVGASTRLPVGAVVTVQMCV